MDIIQSVRDSSQIKKPCDNCGGVAMHRVNDNVLCCECYIKTGNSPADWHPDCLKWKLKLYPPKKWKFTMGDLVLVKGRLNLEDSDNETESEVYIIGLSQNGYEGYNVQFTDTGESEAWFEPDDLTLVYQDKEDEQK